MNLKKNLRWYTACHKFLLIFYIAVVAHNVFVNIIKRCYFYNLNCIWDKNAIVGKVTRLMQTKSSTLEWIFFYMILPPDRWEKIRCQSLKPAFLSHFKNEQKTHCFYDQNRFFISFETSEQNKTSSDSKISIVGPGFQFNKKVSSSPIAQNVILREELPSEIFFLCAFQELISNCLTGKITKVWYLY